MNGLTPFREYFECICLPALTREVPEVLLRIAAGLVGDGSECYGYDDAISQDHDYYPRIMIWLDEEDLAKYGEKIRMCLAQLPRQFPGFPDSYITDQGNERNGVFSIRAFYSRFTGLPHPPSTLQQWRAIPEVNLAAATNGEVFLDNVGIFSDYRQSLLDFYPEDIFLKKLTARLMTMAQAGQYNYPRSLKRGDHVAVFLSAAEFAKAAASAVHLLNQRYCPYYKWAYRSLLQLTLLGEQAAQTLKRIAQKEDASESIEQLCIEIMHVLKQNGLTSKDSDFLLDHGPEVMSHISDSELRASSPWGE